LGPRPGFLFESAFLGGGPVRALGGLPPEQPSDDGADGL
jgi:hypothetical protein